MNDLKFAYVKWLCLIRNLLKCAELGILDVGLELPTTVIESFIKFVQTNETKNRKNFEMKPEMPFMCEYLKNGMFKCPDILFMCHV